jgi:hypothetical protein
VLETRNYNNYGRETSWKNMTDERIILKWILKKYVLMMWAGINWLRGGPSWVFISVVLNLWFY